MTNDERPSRSQLKREAEAVQAMGERLLALPDADLARLELPDDLLEAVRVGRRLRNQRGALRRQRLYIAGLMRAMDTDAFQFALAALEQHSAESRAQFHAVEQWRERLLTEGMPALEAFFDQHPRADRQRLRQLTLAATKEVNAGKPPRRQRELFREIRQVMEDS